MKSRVKVLHRGVMFFGVCDWTIVTVKFILGVGMAITMFVAPIAFIMLLIGEL